ncbi:MAG: hypothetical protein HY735_23800 [Verrucomicrobia bacterium]|nr:hypothetical protein [Verrucomicrobiota bacterium]
MLIPNARLYAARHQLELAETLGSGKDGIVLVAKHKTKPANVAIKVLRFDELYLREKQAYQRLGKMTVTTVLGFNVPQLVGSDDGLRVIEMTIVKRPFVLDFAAAYLDARPEFPEDVWTEWETEKREQFETRWPAVQEVLAAFEELGIYLLDVSPSNIAFLD